MQILCATDFSEPASRAGDVAAAVARAFRVPLRLVHCASDWPLFAEPMLMLNDSLSTAWKEQLEKEAMRLSAPGVEVVTEFRRGEASHELIAAASEQPVKMIVTGATGTGLAERWLLGRVAERVAESATVPVLVVRKSGPLLAWLSGEKPLRVLCGVNLQHSNSAPLLMIRELGGLANLEVEALHLHDDKRGLLGSLLPGHGHAGETGSAAESEELCAVRDRMKDVLGQVPARVHPARTSRHPDHDMAHLADEIEAGLIVVGTHQRHGWQRLTHSFSRGVLAHAAASVLCVPADA
jgi:nucleotide-binding universal stress UspA family protein